MDHIEDFIGVFENAVSAFDCDRLIDRFEYLSDMGLTFSRQQQSGVPKIHNENEIANTDDLIDPVIARSSSPSVAPFIKAVDNCYAKYADKYGAIRSIGPHKISSCIQLQRIRPTQGYHVWHCEADQFLGASRILVPMLYLNTVEEGGETEFLYQSKRVKPKQGTLVLWPAAFTHMHRGNPPLKESKYIMTSWIEYY